MMRATLLISLMLAACQAAPAAQTDVDMHYLALGDSYTIGHGVAEGEGFPEQLADALRAEGIVLADPEIIAATGWPSLALLGALESGTERAEYDLVTLLIGVNDQFQGVSLETYRANLNALLVRAIELAGGQAQHVIVLSIPDWGVTPFAAGYDRGQIGDQIDQFNAVNQNLAQAAGVTYMDVTTISRQADQQPELLADDGLHPSGVMYALWVQALLPDTLAILSD